MARGESRVKRLMGSWRGADPAAGAGGWDEPDIVYRISSFQMRGSETVLPG